MTRTIEISQEELELLLSVLDDARKKANGYANRPILGYGKTSEQMKKDKWREIAERIECLATNIAYQFEGI